MPLSKTRMKGSETVFLSFVQFILINCCHTTLYVLYFIRPSSSDSGNLTRPLCILRPHRDTRCHWCAASETTQPHSAAELQLFHKDLQLGRSSPIEVAAAAAAVEGVRMLMCAIYRNGKYLQFPQLPGSERYTAVVFTSFNHLLFVFADFQHAK